MSTAALTPDAPLGFHFRFTAMNDTKKHAKAAKPARNVRLTTRTEPTLIDVPFSPINDRMAATAQRSAAIPFNTMRSKRGGCVFGVLLSEGCVSISLDKANFLGLRGSGGHDGFGASR